LNSFVTRHQCHPDQTEKEARFSMTFDKVETRARSQSVGSATERHVSPLSILRNRNFRLLWIGEGISVLGSQFYLIALPWLVLQLTHDPLALGTILAVVGIPRALFMLVGGALTDRYSPRVLMLASNVFRLGLVSLLALLVGTGVAHVWMLYVFALCFGLADAFFFPAQTAILPSLVDESQLGVGNSLNQGTAQVSLFAGPVLAGALIALLDRGTGPSGQGIALAFGVNAFGFGVSVVTLALIRVGDCSRANATKGAGSESVLTSIGAGLRYLWYDVPLRLIFLLVAAVTFLDNGPFAVGIPVLAKTRLAEGAVAFGIVMSALGAGALLGMALGAVLPRPAPNQVPLRTLTVASGFGVGLALIGIAPSTPLMALVALVMGIMNGYINILFITWLQTRTPPEMLGRMTSLLMFAVVGLNPISTTLAGIVLGVDATALFVVAGAIETLLVVLTALNPAIRMGRERRETTGLTCP
jgi:MFS family permease